AAERRPFTNLNYYPSQSLVEVNGELWVANVQTPSITRIDPSSMSVLGESAVGSWPVAIAWREGMTHAVVAQRGSDSLGIVDISTGRLVDAIWVGDEPANVVVGPDGLRAYVALKSEGAVAIVDLDQRVRTKRVEVVGDPLAMALNGDGSKLYVASHRSGHPSRFPFEADPGDAERDLAVVDTESGDVVDWWLDIGTTITGMFVDGDSGTLYLSRLRNDTEASLGDTDAPNYFHEVAAFDPQTGAELRSADLTRQASSGGHAVSLHDLTLAADGTLWVAAEGSDLAIALAPDTLEELARVETPGRPRGVVAIADAVFVHGAQQTTVTKIAGQAAAGQAVTASDPRPDTVAAGQYYFTGAGRDYAENWSCNSCHADGLSDTLVWNAGPFSGRKVSRPFFWLEGTYPLGWDGYLSSIDNYAFTVNTNVGVRPVTEEHRALSAYLASMMPPPPANGFTRRDGSLSEEGRRGQEVYEGDAGCASCHPMPLTTSRALLAEGITEGVTDIPGLIGSYRLGVWLKRGEATSLSSAVDQVFASLGDPGLSSDDRAALDRFLQELTARELFVLASEPRPGTSSVASDQPIMLTFSHPVWDDPSNLEAIELVSDTGELVDLVRTLDPDGRHVTLTPQSALEPGTGYTIRVAPSLQSFDERTLWVEDAAEPTPWEVPFTTAASPALRLEGDYVWTIDMPLANPVEMVFDHENTLPTAVPLTVRETASGAEVVLDYGQGLILERVFSVDGENLVSPALPIPIGPSFADSSGMQAAFVDLDNDGVGDFAEGELTISGPGFLESGVRWTFARPNQSGECQEGPSGDVAISVDFSDGLTISFGEGDTGSLGLYVMDPQASPPAGPGQQVSGGDVYWAVQAEMFPVGFASPVVYGEVPSGAVESTVEVGGSGPGAAPLESGKCYKINVLSDSFAQGDYVFTMP
ncbi:MAG: Ig-like domain-containing protein, partial [Nannocystaceae bacterium]